MERLLPSRRLTSVALPSHPGFAALGGIAATADAYAASITVGQPGHCPETPTLEISLFDNSGSITGGNDPVGQRFVEVGRALEPIARRCKCGKCLTATLHFDSPTSGDLQPVRLCRENMEQILGSLAVPADGAGISALLPSLRGARRIAAAHPDHRIQLVVLSDFELFDDYTGDFLAFPADLHAVVLRAKPPRLLIDAPNVTVTRIDYDSQRGAVARAVFSALVAARPGARPLPAPRPA